MHPAIAIDGPAASGKSTVAKLIADRLGYTFINTGAMYRAVTWYMLEQGINPADTAAVLDALASVPLSFGKDGSQSVVLCGQHVLGEELTSQQVNDHVSTIAAIPEVRALLVERQREYNRTPCSSVPGPAAFRRTQPPEKADACFRPKYL